MEQIAAVVMTAVCFVWLGAVLAISFLEAPLKFRAPGITRPLALGLGRLVFRALNRLELVLAASSAPRRSRRRPRVRVDGLSWPS
jgi:hypothetical protein